MRKTFGDDACESRTIIIHMQQRTRDDIPLNLPRDRFETEALALRNRLLAWRFANLGRFRVDPALADPELEDRSNQIALPLLTVARNAENRQRIVAALRQQQRAISADRADALPGEIFIVLCQLFAVGEIVHPGEVADELNRRRAEAAGVEVGQLGRQRVSSHRVGRILKSELELPRDRQERDSRGSRYRLEPRRMAELSQRLGGTLAQLSLSSATISSLQKHCSWPGNADFDLDDDNDDCQGRLGFVGNRGGDDAATEGSDGSAWARR